MQIVPMRQLKSDLSRLIHRVELGEVIAVTKRGLVVAHIIPSLKTSKLGRADSIRSKRTIFDNVPPFDERSVTAEGRKW